MYRNVTMKVELIAIREASQLKSVQCSPNAPYACMPLLLLATCHPVNACQIAASRCSGSLR